MEQITARDAARSFSTVLDRVEFAFEEFVIYRDGRRCAQIIPAKTYTAADFLNRRANRERLDDDFETDCLAATDNLLPQTSDPWLS